MHRQITEAADQWEAMDRDPGALYRGTRLARVMDWADAHPEALNEREAAFIAESDAQAERDVEEREAQHRRELEAAEQLAEAERRRAEQEAASAGRLRRRAIALSGALGPRGRARRRRAGLRPAGPRQPRRRRQPAARGGGERHPAAWRERRACGPAGDPRNPRAVLAAGGRGPATRLPPAVQRPHLHAAPARGRVRGLGGWPFPARGFRRRQCAPRRRRERRASSGTFVRPVRLRPRRRLLAGRNARRDDRLRDPPVGRRVRRPSAGPRSHGRCRT